MSLGIPDSVIPSVYTSTWLVSLFLVLFLAEQRNPLRKQTQRLSKRLPINLALSALALVAGIAIVRPAIALTMHWASGASFGILHWVKLPGPLQAIGGFLALDITFYYWHRLVHAAPVLWRFHQVHHGDLDLDVTTSARFHPGEIVISVGFRVVQVALLGVSPWTVLVYELVFQTSTFFHHSNLRLPARLERALGWLLVTPRMHGIHHSQVRIHTDSNFSVVFSWWDRLHQTLRRDVPQRSLRIGIPGSPQLAGTDFIAMMAAPFRAVHGLAGSNKLSDRSQDCPKREYRP